MSRPHVPAPPAVLHGLDALEVGRSHFAPRSGPVPEVPGYRHLGFIARGGLGEVWSAERVSDGLPVALKIPLSDNVEFTERLVMEAETLQALDHPGIIRLIDLALDTRGMPALVLELVDGDPLHALLPSEGFSFSGALGYFLPVLEAVAYAHSLGVIHRDLKPANILVTGAGLVRVSDFGLALPLDDQRVAFSLTRSGLVAGTVEYLAPECYEPEAEPSSAADIYALGVILYELLTGRPPRGAWSRLSEIRPLDVRLDELMEHAIHPDPAKRLRGAEEFRRRLIAIRDSPPRYAGAPLVTRPVRALDFLWTLLGLYLLGASYCSQQSINNTSVPGLFDLSFGHSQYLGGFWAVWIISCALGPVGAWVTVRLWRFRRVPLREAFPSPFGLRMGNSRGAAWLVAATQLACLPLPVYYVSLIATQTWHWAHPDTPVFQHALAVTRWGSEAPVSPWTWDPGAFFRADRYWIREVVPLGTDGGFYLIDRQSFFIFLHPLLMALGLAGAAAGLLSSAAVIALRCLGGRRWLATVLLLPPTGFMGWDIASLLTEPQTKSGPFPTHTREWAATLLDDLLAPGDGAPPSARLGPHCTDFVNHHSLGYVPRPVFLSWLDANYSREARAHHTVEDIRSWGEWDVKRSAAFNRTFSFETYADPPSGPVTGSYDSLTWGLELAGGGPACRLTSWNSASQPLYSAPPGTLSAPEAEEWLRRWFRIVSTEGCPDLESLLLPVLLLLDPGDSDRDVPADAGTLTTSFREERARWTRLERAPRLPIRAPERLTGGRWRLQAGVETTGVPRDGGGHLPPPAEWTFELVPSETGWRLLRLKW